MYTAMGYMFPDFLNKNVDHPVPSTDNISVRARCKLMYMSFSAATTVEQYSIVVNISDIIPPRSMLRSILRL